jgi:hypothetical protein
MRACIYRVDWPERFLHGHLAEPDVMRRNKFCNPFLHGHGRSFDEVIAATRQFFSEKPSVIHGRAFAAGLRLAIAYGEGLADRLHKAGINPFIDAHGGGYAKFAIELGIARDRINTINDFTVVLECGAKAEGTEATSNAAVLPNLPR